MNILIISNQFVFCNIFSDYFLPNLLSFIPSKKSPCNSAQNNQYSVPFFSSEKRKKRRAKTDTAQRLRLAFPVR